MQKLRRYAFVLMLAVAAGLGCATTAPEAQLVQGYKTIEGSADTTTLLLDRKLIDSDEAIRVRDLGRIAKASLDAGKTRLEACRAAGKDDCSNAVTNIDLGANVLTEIEKFLEAREQ